MCDQSCASQPSFLGANFGSSTTLKILQLEPLMRTCEDRQGHAAAVAFFYFSYNFLKIHRTLDVTPAMAAGVTDSAVGGGRFGCSKRKNAG